MSVIDAERRANVVGVGLIGGSIGMALRARGWQVAGSDADDDRLTQAVEAGAIDGAGFDPDATVTFVAVPVSAVPEAVRQALDRGRGVVTDAGSVKASVLSTIDDPRFVGGHPMAGSEQDGLDGADPMLFEGATWILTPVASTDDSALALVRSVVTSMGARVVALDPDRHDQLVALVSHVPHLTAAGLMTLAAEAAEEHSTLLTLAAGGFRDMTRVASGSPGIWPDICAENRTAILAALDGLTGVIERARDLVDRGDRAGLTELLETARRARTNLPARAAAHPDRAAEVRIPVPDRPGVLAEITTLAGEMGVNIHDLEIAHSAEGEQGVVVLVVDADNAEPVARALAERGYRPALHRLS
jgi:prephenate dehydrogenase